MIGRAAALLCLGLLAPPLAAAQQADPAVEAAVAAALIEEAATLLRRSENAEDRLAAIGKAVTAYESGLAAIRRGLRGLAAQEAALAAEAESRRAETDRTLGLLMAMRLNEAPALLTHPGGPVAHERAGHLMAGLAPGLRAKAEEMRETLDRARALRARQEEARAQARDALAALQSARAAAAESLRDGAPLDPADRTSALLVRGARSLEDFAAAFAKAPAPPGTAPPAYGELPPPVVGRVTVGFGERMPDGAISSGATLEAPAYALVTAPFAATLRFAGPLEGYGSVAILEPEPGRLLILTGLARVDREAGETVMAGEPLGALGALPGSIDEFLFEASAGKEAISHETLYMEARESGVPVDPASWFAFAE